MMKSAVSLPILNLSVQTSCANYMHVAQLRRILHLYSFCTYIYMKRNPLLADELNLEQCNTCHMHTHFCSVPCIIVEVKDSFPLIWPRSTMLSMAWRIACGPCRVLCPNKKALLCRIADMLHLQYQCQSLQIRPLAYSALRSTEPLHRLQRR